MGTNRVGLNPLSTKQVQIVHGVLAVHKVQVVARILTSTCPFGSFFGADGFSSVARAFSRAPFLTRRGRIRGPGSAPFNNY